MKPDQVPAALFERVAHYDTPRASPPVRALRMRFRAAVAPSPSTSHKSQKSESSEQLVTKQSSSEEPAAASCPTRHFIATREQQVRVGFSNSHLCKTMRLQCCCVAHFQSGDGEGNVETGRRLREDVLRLQEEREEEELKARRKVGVSLCLPLSLSLYLS